jgi:hypothetical protein
MPENEVNPMLDRLDAISVFLQQFVAKERPP